ncbi:MAG TPA: hypothetical protein VL501_02970 [Pyrinomonadaceae bacterium]|nr:hypothetical protein [Pyrinomonadaceae bacterium]
MNELDDAWFQMLDAAGEKAALAGREDVAEYLRLKAANDLIRAGAVDWLIDAFIQTAFRVSPPTVKIEREEGHSFRFGTSTMAGTLLTIRLGVRCLSVEAGWARRPDHGIMRGGALARANILHHGRKRHDQELKLVHGPELPEWLDTSDTTFMLDNAERHLRVFLED